MPKRKERKRGKKKKKKEKMLFVVIKAKFPNPFKKTEKLIMKSIKKKKFHKSMVTIHNAIHRQLANNGRSVSIPN